MPLKCIVVALLLQSVVAQGAEVFKWLDEKGQVHYGNQVPEKYKSRAHSLPLSVAPADATPAPKSANVPAPPKEAKPVVAAPSPTPTPAKNETPCQAAQRKYEESAACFAPYRNVNGGIKPEAFEHCKEMKQPPPC